jgi:hypothetical protein
MSGAEASEAVPVVAAAPADAFTSELKWCIAQLELGLKRKDCTPEQGEKNGVAVLV